MNQKNIGTAITIIILYTVKYYYKVFSLIGKWLFIYN